MALRPEAVRGSLAVEPPPKNTRCHGFQSHTLSRDNRMMLRLLLVAAAVAALLSPAPCCAGRCARSGGDLRAGRQEATLAALVALHAGADCSSPRPQGARQLAVLEHAVASVNTHGGVPIGLRVYDTCSSAESAVKATLKALVAAEEDTCLLPPFFLGFVGPDDTDSAEAVAKVVHVFNLTHVVPWRLARPAWLRDHTLHVANTHHDRTAQAVLTMMRQAGWTSFLAVHTGSADASRKAKALLQMAAGSDVCSVSPALHFPVEDVFGKLQQGGRTPSGVVLLADSWSSAVELVSSLPQSLADRQVLVVSADTQLPSQLPAAAAAANVTAILLLEAAATQLAPDFQDVLSSDLASQEGVAEDIWTAPLAHAVRLYGATLRVAQMLKCPGAHPGDACVSADEWHAMVAGASVQADDISRDPISFATDLPTMHRVYLSERGSDLRWAGNITDGGKKLHLMSNWSLPAPPSTASCAGNVEEATVQTSKAGGGGLWPDMIGGHGFYEAVGMMAGAATGLVVLLILCTWIVYRSFRVPGKRRSPASSVSSYTHRS